MMVWNNDTITNPELLSPQNDGWRMDKNEWLPVTTTLYHQFLKQSHNWSNAGAQRNDVLLTVASAADLDFTVQTSVTALTLKSVKTRARKKMCWKMTRFALPMTLRLSKELQYNHTNVE